MWLGQKNTPHGRMWACICPGEPQLFDLSHAQPWWTPQQQQQLMTQQTVPLHLEALPSGPRAATGSQEGPQDERTQLGTRQSGQKQHQISNLMHKYKARRIQHAVLEERTSKWRKTHFTLLSAFPVTVHQVIMGMLFFMICRSWLFSVAIQITWNMVDEFLLFVSI